MELTNITGPAATQNTGLYYRLLTIALYCPVVWCILLVFFALCVVNCISFSVIFSVRATIPINLNLISVPNACNRVWDYFLKLQPTKGLNSKVKNKLEEWLEFRLNVEDTKRMIDEH